MPKIVLLVDATHSQALVPELAQWIQDVSSEGWMVIRHDVPRTATPPQVRALIQADWNADKVNVKSVFLVGHICVPRSGDFAPDGHEPSHKGAWCADTYFGNVAGQWSDSTVNDGGAEKEWNRNFPNDGKFDQSEIPSDLKLAVGRVDFYDMVCFSNKQPPRSELDLLKSYFARNHAYRNGTLTVPKRVGMMDAFSGQEFYPVASAMFTRMGIPIVPIPPNTFFNG